MRLKNAKRKHYIAPWASETPTTKPSPEAYQLLGKYIATINDESDEDTDDTGYYDGDGNSSEEVVSISAGFSFEGLHDSENPAQKMIADMKYKIGEDRRVWFKVVSADGKKQWEGVANVSGIKAGDGDATDYEGFGCTIKWIDLPVESAVIPG